MNPTPATLARDFIAIMNTHLRSTVMDAVRAKNLTPEYAGCCATHDYCDANMMMAEAFAERGIEVDVSNTEHTNLWNAAWAMARAVGFDGNRTFLVDTNHVDLWTLLDDNAEDKDLCQWAVAAKVGDVFPAFINCARVG